MAVKGPNGRDPSLDVYDVPPSVEKGLPLSNHHAVSSWGMLGPDGDTGLGCDGVCVAGGDPHLHPGGSKRDLTTGASSAPTHSVTEGETECSSEPQLSCLYKGPSWAFSRFLRGSHRILARQPQTLSFKSGRV